ncbi:MAG: hypothetical protein LBH60_02035 [Prevotellaceae bacterium]|jgi:hypothetical protein|nr:hypothetical protein [Prevotellaceae bacterium]
METKDASKKAGKPFIIANPIYDTVFKRLMENLRIAKFFFSTILNGETTSVNFDKRSYGFRLLTVHPDNQFEWIFVPLK